MHVGFLIRLTVPELTSAEVLASLCTELLIAVEGFMGLNAQGVNAQGSPSSSPEPRGPGEVTSSAPQYNPRRSGGAPLHGSAAAAGFQVGLPVPAKGGPCQGWTRCMQRY